MHRLSAAKRHAYGWTGFALTAAGMPLTIYMPKFYSDVMGVAVGTIGSVLMLGSVFDAVTDPAVGLISDNAHTRWGRRRPFIAVASVPLAIMLILLVAPPVMTPGDAVTWFLVTVLGLHFCWTLIGVPYESLGAEIAYDYDERTRVLGLRDGLSLVGLMVAIVGPVVIGSLLASEGQALERERFMIYGWVLGPTVVLAAWWCATGVRERPRLPQAVGAPGRLAELLDNRPFLMLAGGFALSTVSTQVPATLLLYYVPYVLGSPNAEPYLVAYVSAGILCVPLWLAAARRFEKRSVWLVAMAINAVAHGSTYFLGPGQEAQFVVLAVVGGTPMGALVALPASMQADAIDLGQLRSGMRREGLYTGVWLFIRKMMAAVGLGFALWIVEGAGYVPNAPQGPEVQLWLRRLFGLAPALLHIAAIALVWRYPITRARHRGILESIESTHGPAHGPPSARL